MKLGSGLETYRSTDVLPERTMLVLKSPNVYYADLYSKQTSMFYNSRKHFFTEKFKH